MQELRARLVEAEETARTAERQKNQLQRQLQDFRRRLTPLHLEMQRMVEKVGWVNGGHSFFWCRAELGSVWRGLGCWSSVHWDLDSSLLPALCMLVAGCGEKPHSHQCSVCSHRLTAG